MIARQRDNLQRTFAARQDPSPNPEILKRITTNQQELLNATAEFAEGMSQQGPVPDLEEAVRAMMQALAALEASDLDAGQFGQEEALQALIKARQNIRQILKMGSSSSASECRKFDRQQRQKLRTPEELKQQQEQQMAQMRQQMNQLAEQQRKWSEDVRSGSQQSSSPQDQQQAQPQSEQQSSSSSQSQSQSSQSQSSQSQSSQSQSSQSQSSQSQSSQSQSSQSQSESQSRSAESLAQRQREALERARQLREQLDQSEGASAASRERMQEAVEAMESSLQELAGQDSQRAADRAEEVADRLRELAEHLAALNSADFSEQLGHAQRLARRLAERQEQLGQEMSGGSQSEQRSGAAPSGGGQSGETGSENSPRNPSQASNGSSDDISGSAAERQRGLADTTELLDDLLERLGQEAVDEAREARQLVEQLQARNPPSELARTMREAAAEWEQGQAERAGESAGHAARGLHELADGLADARGRIAQPRLEDLIKLEQQIAEILEALQRDDPGERAMVQSRQQQALQRLDQLARSDRQLAQALEAARQSDSVSSSASQPPQSAGSSQAGENTQAAGNPQATGNSQAGDSSQAANRSSSNDQGGSNFQPSGDEPRARDSGFQQSSQVAGSGALRPIARALQTRIQEAILAGVLQESDESVPLEYRELVKQYYRELSDDLR